MVTQDERRQAQSAFAKKYHARALIALLAFAAIFDLGVFRVEHLITRLIVGSIAIGLDVLLLAVLYHMLRDCVRILPSIFADRFPRRPTGS
jgi:Co/Zn/Cd efflux system component